MPFRPKLINLIPAKFFKYRYLEKAVLGKVEKNMEIFAQNFLFIKTNHLKKIYYSFE